MPLTVTWEESDNDTRGFNISPDSFDYNYKFLLCGNFYEVATDIGAPFGPSIEDEVVKYAISILPPTRTGTLLSGQEVTLSLNSVSGRRTNDEEWELDVTYGKPKEGDTGGGGDPDSETENHVQLGFNVSSEQENIRRSWGSLYDQRISITGDVLPDDDARLLIGGENSEAEGTQVYSRGFSFNITQYFSPQRLTFAYVRRLFRMSTCLNQDVFFGFPKRSVLFLEASASGDLYSDVPVTFDFQMKMPFKFKATGPHIWCNPDQDDPAKMFDVIRDTFFVDSPQTGDGWPYGEVHSGWDVVDYRYYKTLTADDKHLYQAPLARLVHIVYLTADFRKFNL